MKRFWSVIVGMAISITAFFVVATKPINRLGKKTANINWSKVWQEFKDTFKA